MLIRKACFNDINSIMPLFETARKFMTLSGNPGQWINGYPSKELILNNIEAGDFYVCVSEDENELVGAFFYKFGNDVTYDKIYNGEWLNNEPYGVVHRLASNGKQKRLSDICFEWCSRQCCNIRVDTHRDNIVMQKALLRNGFKYCGIIYLTDGRERLAFHKIK